MAARLKRHFWRAGYFEDLVARLANGKPASERQQLFAHLGTLPEARPLAFEGFSMCRAVRSGRPHA